jgi:hypothetical protein
VEESRQSERALVIGPVQALLIERATRSQLLLVVPLDRRERRSLQRLTARGIMSPAEGWPTCHRLVMAECEIMSGGKSG